MFFFDSDQLYFNINIIQNASSTFPPTKMHYYAVCSVSILYVSELTVWPEAQPGMWTVLLLSQLLWINQVCLKQDLIRKSISLEIFLTMTCSPGWVILMASNQLRSAEVSILSYKRQETAVIVTYSCLLHLSTWAEIEKIFTIIPAQLIKTTTSKIFIEVFMVSYKNVFIIWTQIKVALGIYNPN